MNMEGFEIVYVVGKTNRGYLPIGFKNGKEVYRGEYRKDPIEAFEACIEMTREA